GARDVHRAHVAIGAPRDHTRRGAVDVDGTIGGSGVDGDVRGQIGDEVGARVAAAMEETEHAEIAAGGSAFVARGAAFSAAAPHGADEDVFAGAHHHELNVLGAAS